VKEEQGAATQYTLQQTH